MDGRGDGRHYHPEAATCVIASFSLRAGEDYLWATLGEMRRALPREPREVPVERRKLPPERPKVKPAPKAEPVRYARPDVSSGSSCSTVMACGSYHPPWPITRRS